MGLFWWLKNILGIFINLEKLLKIFQTNINMKLKTNTPKKFFFEKRTVKSHPLVSIIVPTYNNEKLIENCVMSIFNQSFSDFELIIVDDCSEDDTLKILEEIKDSRLRFFKRDVSRNKK